MDTINFKDLQRMVEINSWTHNKSGVDQYGRLMANWLTTLGFSLEVFERESVGNHLLFCSRHQEGAPRLLLLGHLDTVFPPNTFTAFNEDEEWVYGPGTCDMKGGNFVALSALRRLHAEQGQVCNIDLLLVSDEETGSDDSKLVTKQLANHYSACLDFEAAGANHEVVDGRKGVATFCVNIEGIAAHAGNCYLEGRDANLAAAKLLIELTALTDIDKGTTVNVGKMEGGISTNTISPHAQLMVEVRFTQNTEQARVLEDIPALINACHLNGIKASYSGGLQRDVMTQTPEQEQLLHLIGNVIGYPLLTEQRGGVSDANVTAGAGVPTLDGFGPFGDGDHTEHERALKSSFVRRTEEVTAILKLFSEDLVGNKLTCQSS